MIRAPVLIALGALAAVGASAQPISLRDSFAIGSGPGITCTAQSAPTEPALSDMFDRGYRIVCRDAAAPVGRLYALRTRGGDPAARLAALRAESCASAERLQIEGLGTVESTTCGDTRIYKIRRGNTLFAAEGLAGYESALRLGLRTLIEDRPVEGRVEVATTGAGDAAAFARSQAAALDPQRALEEAYRRNNAGAYAESSEYFAILGRSEVSTGNRAEALVNEALQRSNLGRFGEADAMFAQAEPLVARDAVLARRLRNYRAMHLLNQLQPGAALAELDRPLPPGALTPPRAVPIDRPTSLRLNRESPVSRQLDTTGGGLLPEDKVAILDAQALHLRGSVHRIEHRPVEAEAALRAAEQGLVAVRGGRVASVVWLRSQIEGELGALAEARGDATVAERRHQQAVALLAVDYPGSPALLAAQARQAGFYARTGRAGPARALFRAIVDANVDTGSASPSLRRSLAPYFALLAADGDSGSVADMFRASQILLRPGVAQTQAVLARELSGGSDESARLFRQSVSLTRDIERARVELARAEAAEPADPVRVAELRAGLADLERDQVATQARLAEFPRYRAVAAGAMSLPDLQALLAPGEAYFKLIQVGDSLYGLLATPDRARTWRIEASPAEIEADVDALRATISLVEDGRAITYPFDVERSHALYRRLFGPVAAEMGSVRHLVFEPDGAMLRLPLNLLVASRDGMDAYRARAARPGDDGFDFTGIDWLGRDRDVTTSVSATSFRDIRRIAPSRAAREYLGFGENAPAPGFFEAPVRLAAAAQDCAFSPAAWSRPISAEELQVAGLALGRGRPGATELVIGAAFTDSAILARSDLGQFRVLHFATHGLLRAPREDCPAQPALLTSFGGQGSDGLLSFREIFDLHLDADLIILSACDTAGGASAAATREAGITTGGDFALDGLVRAFVGAGGRSVVASHWPVPDDYDATKRLISGLFSAPAGTSTATAMRRAQRALMDDPDTSHPYYWSGFAIVGDGARPVVAATAVASAGQ
jgi:CHAT domain-containing protein